MTNFREILTTEKGKKITEILEEVKSKEARIDIVAALVEEYVYYLDVKSEQQLLDLGELFIGKHLQMMLQYGYKQAEKEAKKAALKAL